MNEKRKILVIDDDNVIRMIVHRILERHGYEVVLATNGNEGLQAADSVSPDVILLDVNLPDIDGHEVCAKFRSQRTTFKTPIILVTASDEPEEKARGFDKGANDYLTKPFSDDALIACIEKQLRR